MSREAKVTKLEGTPVRREVELGRFWDREKAREQQRLVQRALNARARGERLTGVQRTLLSRWAVPEWAHGVRVVPADKGWVKVVPGLRKLRRSYSFQATDATGH